MTRCGECGAELPAEFRFCGRCGAAIARSSEPAREGERRHLSVLFCDIADSTELAGRIGAERWRELLEEFHAACDAVVQRHAGRVAQYLGDGVLVYFGHPRAHDDDAERALRSALEIQRAVQALGERIRAAGGASFAVRVGVHTGLAVVGEIGHGARREELALGDTLHLAARLQGVAQPGEVVCSGDTLRLTRDRFRVESIGSQRLKGFIDAVPAFRVLERAGAGGARAASSPSAQRPWIGRAHELSVLETALADATAGRGRTVSLSGEPGIGKTRLLQTLAAELTGRPHRWLAAGCSPYETSRALAPFVALLDQELGASDNDPEVRRKELDRMLAAAGLDAAAAGAALAPLLGLPAEGVEELSPALQRRRALEALAAWLTASPQAGPTALVIEDLHWADPSTLELLGILRVAAQRSALLLVMTWRPEFQAPWPALEGSSALALSRLAPDEARALARSVAGDAPISDERIDLIVERSEGVPLFVEEFTKTSLELGAAGGATGIPATLQETLAARLDRTEEGKELAQLAAVIGREFSLATLRALAGLPERALAQGLRRLIDAELVFPTGPSGQSYRFKHALIRDAAYDSLLERTRRRVHERVGRLLADEAPPEVVAHHFSAAACHRDALLWWQRAAERSGSQNATSEARGQLERALAHVAELPPGGERDVLEARLLLLATRAEMEQSGFASPRLAELHARNERLTASLGDPLLRLDAMMLKATYENTTGRFESGVATMRSLFRALESTPGIPVGPMFLNVLAIILVNRSELTEALALSDRARDAAESAPPMQRMPSYPDAWVTCESHAGLILSVMGRLDQALARGAEALERAERLEPPHPYSVGWARNYLSLVHYHRGELAETLALSETNQRLGEERAFATWWLMGSLMSACARIELGELSAAIPQLEQGIGLYEMSGARMIVSFFRGVLAEAKLRQGAHDEAAALLASARELADEIGERYARPELERIEAELWLARGNPREAEAAYRRGIERALRHGQGLWALRAATPLATLLAEGGRRDEARAALAPILTALPADDGSPPLARARRLLGEL